MHDFRHGSLIFVYGYDKGMIMRLFIVKLTFLKLLSFLWIWGNCRIPSHIKAIPLK